MTAFLRIGGALAADDRGATAIEYALLAALIAGVLISGVQSIGGTVTSVFTKTNNDLVTYAPKIGP